MQIPGLTDGWTELRDKFVSEKDTFKSGVLEKHQAKKEEYRVWKATVQQACDAKDHAAQERIQHFEKKRKEVVRSVHNNVAQAAEVVPAAKVRACRRQQTYVPLISTCHGATAIMHSSCYVWARRPVRRSVRCARRTCWTLSRMRS